jgi:hypothetical protein
MKTTHKQKILRNTGFAMVFVAYIIAMGTDIKLDHTYSSLDPTLAALGFIAALAVALPGLVLTHIYLRAATNR